MKKRGIYLLSFLLIIFALQSCGVNSNIMFKTPKGSDFKYDTISMRPKEDYRISRDDRFIFTISTNSGQRIIERMSGLASGQVMTAGQQIDYLVKSDGYVNLPILGEIKVDGLTVKNLEDTLKKMYSAEFQDPFVQVRLTNQRVLVFPGNGGDALVVPLQNSNTTLMEAIAAAGGITERGKAKSIKLMRMVGGKREVYLIDLSTIDGLIFADMIVQANDYIYVEPNPRIGREILAQATPFITIFSSVFVIFTILRNN
jgi:polysaccharide export outer membrane protein